MTELLPYIVGPFGAVVSLAVVLFGVFRFIDSRIWPLVTASLDRHLQQIDKLIASHDADRAVWSEGLAGIKADVDVVRDDVHEIRERLDGRFKNGAA